jgi:hypothetical protein
MKNLIIIAGLVGPAGMAHADDAATSFARGKAALKAKKIHEACEAFAASEQAKAAVETELALAGCLEQDGKLVAAANMYRTAAANDSNAKRKQTSSDKASKLSARAPKLRFAINPRPDDILIKVDGVAVPTVGDVMVDLGPHEVVATAAGYEGHASAPVDREGQILDVILRMEATAPAPAPEKDPAIAAEPASPAAPAAAPMAEPEQADAMPMPAEHAPSHRRRNGLIVGGVGVAAAIGAAVFFKVGSNKLDDQHELCPDKLCGSQADADKANSLRDDGRRYRGIGIGMGIGGVVLIAAGAVLFATAPSDSESPVALKVDRDGGVLSYSFGF